MRLAYKGGSHKNPFYKHLIFVSVLRLWMGIVCLGRAVGIGTVSLKAEDSWLMRLIWTIAIVAAMTFNAFKLVQREKLRLKLHIGQHALNTVLTLVLPLLANLSKESHFVCATMSVNILMLEMFTASFTAVSYMHAFVWMALLLTSQSLMLQLVCEAASAAAVAVDILTCVLIPLAIMFVCILKNPIHFQNAKRRRTTQVYRAELMSQTSDALSECFSENNSIRQVPPAVDLNFVADMTCGVLIIKNKTQESDFVKEINDSRDSLAAVPSGRANSGEIQQSFLNSLDTQDLVFCNDALRNIV